MTTASKVTVVGVMAVAVAVAAVVAPAVVEMAALEIPRMYGSVLSWLTPPYLYFIVNGIIITIAASSKLMPAPEMSPEVEISPAPEMSPAVEISPAIGTLEEEEVEKEEVEEFVISRSEWVPERRRRTDGGETPAPEEKPPVSSRFSGKKSVKASPEGGGKLLGVSRPRRNETLDSTWKMITDGRAVPLTRHLKKSDTWDAQGRLRREPSPMKKSETFSERRTIASPSRLWKEPSLSQDELNRRVEAFINKFNEEMRLQRQDSVKHYREMINRETQ